MNLSKCNLSYEEREPIAVLIKFGAGFDDIKNEFEKRFNKRLRLEVTRIFIPSYFFTIDYSMASTLVVLTSGSAST